MSDKKIELKACPFCGKSSAKIKEDVVSQQGIIARVKYVTCEDCGARTRNLPKHYLQNKFIFETTDEDVARVWNTRLEED